MCSRRLIWVDALKGVAIICVVMGHSPGLTELPTKLFNIIFSFHIPLFYFISGYLFKPNISCNELIKGRFRALIMPYLFTVISVSAVYLMLRSKPSPFWHLLWILYGNGPNLAKPVLHLWFLPNLFLVNLLAWFLFKYCKIGKLPILGQLVLLVVFLICGFLFKHTFWDLNIPITFASAFIGEGHQILANGLLDNPAYSREILATGNSFVLKGFVWSSDITLLTVAFFLSGYVVKQHRLETLFHRKGIMLCFLIVLGILHYYYDYTIDLNLRRYDSLIVCTVLAYGGIYICTYFAFIITNNYCKLATSLQYIGGSSLIIFIFHPSIQSRIYYFIVLSLFEAPYLAIIPAFLAGLCLPLLLDHAVLKKYGFFRFWYHAR